MKRIATLSLCVTSLFASAQNVKLETGKKFTAVSSIKMDMDMGEGGQMTMESSKTALFTITSADAGFYKGNTSLIKMKVSQEGAGQSMSYDSENKSDSSELAKTLAQELNQKDPISIDKTTGVVRDDNPEKPKETADENPLSALIGSDSPASSLTNAFLVIPAGKKVGDKWSDSTNKDGKIVVQNFELKSLEKGIATIDATTITKGTLEKEAQGMQITITMNGTSQSEYTTEVATGIVKKNNTTGKIEGTMDVMGQSMPLTITTTSSSTVE